MYVFTVEPNNFLEYQNSHVNEKDTVGLDIGIQFYTCILILKTPSQNFNNSRHVRIVIFILYIFKYYGTILFHEVLKETTFKRNS